MKNGKVIQSGVLTAIVGSYPKPLYLSKKSGRQLLDELGVSLDTSEKQLGSKMSQARFDKAARSAISDQNSAGIDLITDGEERRNHYVLHVLKGLHGIDFQKRTRVSYRGGVYERDAPTVTDEIKYVKPFLVKEFLFTKKYAKGIAKIGLPGPSTVVDCIADGHYGNNKKKMAFDYADAIHHEVGALIKAGCRAIQFDDPVLLRFPERAREWGLKALERCFAGFENKATFIVHVCRGYPNKPLEKKGIEYKAKKEYYKDVLSWLSRSNIDVVSIEAAQGNLDLSVLPAIGKKTVMLGVLDVGLNKVESVESLVARGREALRYIPKQQLILAPDCGMLELSRTSAKKKLANMAKAAKKLNALT